MLMVTPEALRLVQQVTRTTAIPERRQAAVTLPHFREKRRQREQDEPEDDDLRRLHPAEIAQDDRHHGRDERADEGDAEAERREIGGFRVRHDDHADKTDDHGAPAVHAGLLYVRQAGLLIGFRGSLELYVASLAGLIVVYGRIMAGTPLIREIDLNPVIIKQEG